MPQNPIMTTARDRLALAVDIGGTKFAAAIVNESGEVLVAQRIATPRTPNREDLFDALTTVIDATLQSAGLTLPDPPLVPAIGLGTAAPLDITAGTISPVNIAG